MNPLFLKRIVLFLFLLSFASLVSAQDYNIAIVEVDKIICSHKDISYDYEGVIENIIITNNKDNFDLSFFDSLKSSGFTVEGIQNGVYKILKEKSIYYVETDGTFYYIRHELPKKVLISEIKGEYNQFREDIRLIRLAIEEGAEKVNRTKCRVGANQNHALFDMVNIYNLSSEQIKCDYDTGDIIADCNKNLFITNSVSEIWSDLKYHNKNSYVGDKSSIVFVDLDEMKFNEINKVDHITEPAIIFSERLFSKQTVYVNHIEYIRKLEKIPIIIADLKRKNQEIEDFTNNIFENLDKAKQINQNNPEDIEKFIEKNNINVTQVKEYVKTLSQYQNDYHNNQRLIKSNPRNYYEDIYYGSANEYLIELNAELEVFKTKLDILLDLQSKYDSFNSNIISNDNSTNSITISLLITTIAILVSVLLFVFEALLKRYGNKLATDYIIICIIVLGFILGALYFLNLRWIEYIVLILGIIILLGGVLWVIIPYIIPKKTPNKVEMQSFNWVYKWKMNLLSDLYIVAYNNSEIDLYNSLRDRVFVHLENIVKLKEIINSNHESNKLKRENYRDNDKIRKLAKFLKELLEDLISHGKIANKDKNSFKRRVIQMSKIEENNLLNIDSVVVIEDILKEGSELRAQK